MRPVCVKCQIEFRPKINGVYVVEYANFGPYKIWQADLWACPECHTEIVSGFALQPVAIHHDKDFAEILTYIKEDPLARVIDAYENIRSRPA